MSNSLYAKCAFLASTGLGRCSPGVAFFPPKLGLSRGLQQAVQKSMFALTASEMVDEGRIDTV